MKTSDLLFAVAFGLIAWLMYRALDQRAEAVSLITDTPQTEPWSPLFELHVERVKLPLLVPDPVTDRAVIVDYDVQYPAEGF